MKSPTKPRKQPKQRIDRPTPRQRIAAKLYIENRGTPVNAIMKAANYSDAIQKNPHQVLESKGFKAELAKYGLTEQFITTALVEDINLKPQKRVEELKLASDILGMRKREESTNNTLNLMVFSPEQAMRIAERIAQKRTTEPN